MGLKTMFDRLFKRSVVAPTLSSVSSSTSIATPIDNQLFSFIGGANSALSISTVYLCTKFLSDSVAQLPLQCQKLKNGIFVSDTESRLTYLLNVQPNDNMSAFDFWYNVVSNMLLEGNAYIVPVYNNATLDIDSLILCNRGTVSHDTINNTYNVFDMENGLTGLFRESEIIHLMNISLDGKNGLSVIGFARTTMNIAATGDNETLKRFANGGNVRGLVSNDTSVKGFGEYQDTELKKTATDIDTKFQGGERIVSIPGQVKFDQVSLSSTDMQFLESRKFTTREICRFFSVHPSFVFDDMSTNYKSAEMANVAFLSHTLNPLLRKIETELLRKLIAPSLSTKRRFNFDRRGLYACDLDTKVKYQTQTIAAGIYTVNEWRKEENKPEVEGGDKVLVSANLKDINESTNSGLTNNNSGDESKGNR